MSGCRSALEEPGELGASQNGQRGEERLLVPQPPSGGEATHGLAVIVKWPPSQQPSVSKLGLSVLTKR